MAEQLMRDTEICIREQEWEGRKGVFLRPPERIPTAKWTDAPLLGNGDVGVAIGGGAEEQTFYIGKNDFWVQPHLGETEQQRRERLLSDNGRRTGARIITVGQVTLFMPQLQGAEYWQEQHILEAEVRGSFRSDAAEAKLCTWVAAGTNVLVTELECVRGTLDVKIRLHAGEKSTDEVFNYDNGAEDGLMWFRYAANSANVPETRRVAVATCVVGADARYEWRFQNVEAEVTVAAGERIAIVTAIVSNRDEADYFAAARKLAAMYGGGGWDVIARLKEAHRLWWRGFWTASEIGIGDPVLEKFYYGSYYIIGSCTRQGKIPPGLFGNWITTDRPAWTGSYTMNYNYEAPFWGLYAGNRVELAASYCEPLLAFMPWGKLFAKEKLGCRGLYMPVELGPDGMICSMFFHGQKSNAAFAAVNLLMHIDYTQDMDYARKVYPYLIEVANFWEDYLVYEDGRYVIYDDDIHERSHDRKNPILSLGFIRMMLTALLELSAELGLDGERREKWRHILDHLSEYPLMERGGRTVVRLTEEGRDWGLRNSLAVQHVFPAGAIGLDSDPELLAIARNTVDEMQRWSDFNAFPTYYAAAARVGYDPRVILERLRFECEEKSFPNLSIHHGGGGIEDASAVPVCLQEMLLQSHERTLRLFPVWPPERPARFRKLRAAGAFLVSSDYAGGEVKYVVIESEQGRPCRIQNPWPGRDVAVYRDGCEPEQAAGERFTLATAKGERLVLLPAERLRETEA
ncbi:hypothetical protein SD70_22930 [Gordoniibacillus kamchatkensis]|uniref:Glycosyl hydrolase family 95 catalytic domain-containing protein n=2 Tax=Gordoniibacillus kamchatkensis TaxID=1590651 RepID=A0ABR5AD79_9BACL|nr:hypothetical protein SD70_22930 [Paenibacillus sp. VKM B-2647]